MAEEAVKVAVRVRPFNKREKEASSKLIVAMTGNTTILTHPQTGEEKKFTYDYSYWSHDGFTEMPDGYNKADGTKYHDQLKVFNDLGQGVLTNAWEGYNASLFAYGQTGSGKSYSVVGYGNNKGIVPQVCDAIFKTAATITDKQIEVYFSMLEIYSEVVRDLLSPSKDRKQGLMIRQDPKNGFYPQGLQKTLVNSYDAITKLTDEGTANRTVASTNMNATSSRAHTIVTVTLIQKYKNDGGKEMAKTSVINLVDLAGSERADATGATGDRLKEGAAINLSLTALGNVISALADNSSGKNVKVPYRDSSLTKLLMNALGGNSKTIMIAAISPADINFDESVSTCRYADRAKQIKTKAMVNEDPTEKLIRDLKAENEKLKEMLKNGKIDPSMLEDGHKLSKAEKDAELEAMRKQIEENEKEEEQMKLDYEAKLAAALAAQKSHSSERDLIMEKAKTVPHLTNLNMDPYLSQTIKLLLEGEGPKTLGPEGKSNIALYGVGICDPHGQITVKGGKFQIERFNDAKILRNGRPVTNKTEFSHLDRFVFGCSQYYIFIDPSKVTANDPKWSFEKAQEEVGKASGAFITDTKNMTQDEILCMGELIDILPHIEEANEFSKTLDKKVKFSAMAVSSASRGDYDSRSKVYILMKHFAQGLEWTWTKEKFMARKADMNEFYLDFKEDNKIDLEKFQASSYDPFYESPDTPTQIGTAILYPSQFAHMIAFKESSKILDFKSREAGEVEVEIIPCQANGTPISDSKLLIRNPEKELLNKNISFIVKINCATGIKDKFEDIYCQFQMFGDSNIYKTAVVKEITNPKFNFTKQFSFTATEALLKDIMTKPLYVQVWSEQKHPPKNSKKEVTMSTVEYFKREQEIQQNISGKTISNKVDPEKQSLRSEIEILKSKNMKLGNSLNMVNKLCFVAKDRAIPGQTVTAVMNAATNEEADKIIKDYFERAGTGNGSLSLTNMDDSEDYENSLIVKNSQACNIL